MIANQFSKKPLRPDMFHPFAAEQKRRARQRQHLGPVNSQGIPLVHLEKLQAFLMSLPQSKSLEVNDGDRS
jgi:hypothetical protein